MALPIKPTPILDEEESERFLEMVSEDLNTPSYPRTNPDRLEEARKKAAEYANLRSKSSSGC